MHIDVNGDANLCFGHTWTSKHAGNILLEDPMKIWHGKAATEFRQSILDGSFRYCTSCRCPELLDDKASPSEDLSYIDVLALAYDYRCNIACPSCRHDKVKPSPLCEQIHRRILDSSMLLYVKNIAANGSGEPLASPLFWDLIAKLSTLPCHPELGLILCTNGLLVTPARLNKILDTRKPLRRIEISMDAASEKTYAENRRGGDWLKLLANLAFLAETKIPLRLNFVVQQNNFHEMPGFVDLALHFGADHIRFDALSDWGSWSTSEFKARSVHLPTHPQHQELVKVLADYRLRDPRVHLARLSDEYFATLDPLKTIHLRNKRSP